MSLLSIIRHVLAGFCGLALLAGCGGGNSSVTTIICSTSNCSTAGPTVGDPFVQKANNLEVKVEGWVPNSSFTFPPTNVLFATVTVCASGSRPTDSQPKCAAIDHLQVDTGSIGLRVLASKVSSLGLIPVELTAGQAYECYPFIIGGLWGPVVGADVGLGQQWTTPTPSLPVQLIQDDATVAIQAPADCITASDKNVFSSASALGSNGILGIGNMTLDCGLTCLSGNYAGTYVQYYSCPPGAKSSVDCSAAAVGANQQVYNPVAALSADQTGVSDNNGVVLVLPKIPDTGASVVLGELIFGVNTRSASTAGYSGNQLAAGASKVYLGVDFHNNDKSYLKVSTQYNGQTSYIYNSYLDTGTNGLFFTDSSIPLCTAASATASSWFCPGAGVTLSRAAIISDGDVPGQNPVGVNFLVGDQTTLQPSISAFAGMAGAPATSTTGSASFSWGLPFFYGKRVALSIWQQKGAETGPWYSWSLL